MPRQFDEEQEPLFRAHGEEDFARERAHETFAMLRGQAMSVRFELVPELGHAYPTDFAERIDEALNFLLG